MRVAVRTTLLGAAIAIVIGGIGDLLMAQGGGIGVPPCTAAGCGAVNGACTPKVCYSCACTASPPGAPEPFYCFATYIC